MESDAVTNEPLYEIKLEEVNWFIYYLEFVVGWSKLLSSFKKKMLI